MKYNATMAQRNKCAMAQDKLAMLSMPSMQQLRRVIEPLVIEHSNPRRDAVMVAAQLRDVPESLQPRLVK